MLLTYMLFSEGFSIVLSFMVDCQINAIFEILFPICLSNDDIFYFIVLNKVKPYL